MNQLSEGTDVTPRVSQEMRNAQALLWAGKTGYAAAKASGISESAISKSEACQHIIRAVRKAIEILSTDEQSTDAALVELFKEELCMPEHRAIEYVGRRAQYLGSAAGAAPAGVGQ